MSRKLRIAVVENEPDMQEYYQMILPALAHGVAQRAGGVPVTEEAGQRVSIARQFP